MKTSYESLERLEEISHPGDAHTHHRNDALKLPGKGRGIGSHSCLNSVPFSTHPHACVQGGHHPGTTAKGLGEEVWSF